MGPGLFAGVSPLWKEGSRGCELPHWEQKVSTLSGVDPRGGEAVYSEMGGIEF